MIKFSSIAILNCYNGQVTVTDIQISNLKLKLGIFLLISTDLQMTNFNVKNITQYSGYLSNLVNMQLNSNMVLTNATISDINAQIFYSDMSTFEVYGATLFNVTCIRSTIQIVSSSSIIMTNINFTSSVSNAVAIISFTK